MLEYCKKQKVENPFFTGPMVPLFHSSTISAFIIPDRHRAIQAMEVHGVSIVP